MKKRVFKKFSNYTYLGENYKNEFRKQIRSIIVITLGFTIAFAWREAIFDWSKSATAWITNSSNGGSATGAATFITLICILLIFFTSRLLKNK